MDFPRCLMIIGGITECCIFVPWSMSWIFHDPVGESVINLKLGILNDSGMNTNHIYPLVNIQKAIEHGHRNSGFTN